MVQREVVVTVYTVEVGSDRVGPPFLLVVGPDSHPYEPHQRCHDDLQHRVLVYSDLTLLDVGNGEPALHGKLVGEALRRAGDNLEALTKPN